jgi:hypothetical protein
LTLLHIPSLYHPAWLKLLDVDRAPLTYHIDLARGLNSYGLNLDAQAFA